MTAPSPDFEPARARLDALMNRLCDEVVDDAARAELNDLLRCDAELRRHYLHSMFIHAGLTWGAIAGRTTQGVSPSAAAPPALPRPAAPTAALRVRFADVVNRPLVFSMLVATVTVVSLLLTSAQIFMPEARVEREAVERKAAAVRTPRPVRVTGLSYCKFEHTPPLILGAALAGQEEIELAQGMLELTFEGEVKVLVEGPARVRALSGRSCRLNLGKLTARVPPAGRNFTVETPTAAVVDLGTEFGVEVLSNGKTQVHVFEGVVECSAQGAAARRVTSGAALALSPEQAAAPIVFNASHFTRKLPPGGDDAPEYALGQVWTRAMDPATFDPTRRSSPWRYVSTEGGDYTFTTVKGEAGDTPLNWWKQRGTALNWVLQGLDGKSGWTRESGQAPFVGGDHSGGSLVIGANHGVLVRWTNPTRHALRLRIDGTLTKLDRHAGPNFDTILAHYEPAADAWHYVTRRSHRSEAQKLEEYHGREITLGPGGMLVWGIQAHRPLDKKYRFRDDLRLTLVGYEPSATLQSEE